MNQQDEEARAALWRDQQRQRAAFQAQLWASLRGDPAARDQLLAAWAPVIWWLLERQEPSIAPDEDPAVDPLGISDTVNVGT